MRFEFYERMAKLHIGSRIAPPVLLLIIHHIMRSEHETKKSGGRTFESFRARPKNNLHVRNDAMQNEIICMAETA
jgi:hypothetical protein